MNDQLKLTPADRIKKLTRNDWMNMLENGTFSNELVLPAIQRWYDFKEENLDPEKDFMRSEYLKKARQDLLSQWNDAEAMRVRAVTNQAFQRANGDTEEESKYELQMWGWNKICQGLEAAYRAQLEEA